ncbi:hypothetical protein ACSNOI_15160, partial [Actinomadura kijaniata]
MSAVTFRDETATGTSLAEFQVTGLPSTMTVRELIRLRVRRARHLLETTDRTVAAIAAAVGY